MSFGWLGTFRQGSWQAFRRFILEERRDIGVRIQTIQAELSRIGSVTVLFQSDTDDQGNTTVTEERVGFTVPENSSLGKLLQAYTAMGGNPFDISLFLTPDAILSTSEGTPTQPHKGVVYARSGSYTTGDQYQGGYMDITKYTPARVGGDKKIEDYAIAALVKKARGWTNKEIRYKRNDLEARILKLCDLREQLQTEIQELTWMGAGVIPALPYFDEDRFDSALSVASIVATIDAIFYEVDDDGTADFETENTEELGAFPYLISDISPDEDNTAL